MRIGEEARSMKQVLCSGEGVSAALGRKRKGRGRNTLSFEVKIRLASPSDLQIHGATLPGMHALRALTAGERPSH
jgi:hypothetical protein